MQSQSASASSAREGFTVSLGEISFPDVGDASIAYRISSSAKSALSVAIVVIAVEDKVTWLFDFGDGADGEFLEFLKDVATAVDRLE
jgi:hypothetical protein